MKVIESGLTVGEPTQNLVVWGPSHRENKTQKDEGVWVEESAVMSLRNVHFAHRRCRWVIIPLDHYCVMTKLLSPKRIMAKGCLKNDVRIDKKSSVRDVFLSFLNVRQMMKKWGE